MKRASFLLSFLLLGGCPTPLRGTCAEIEYACEHTSAPSADTAVCEVNAEVGGAWTEAMCVSERARCLAICTNADGGGGDAADVDDAGADGAP